MGRLVDEPGRAEHCSSILKALGHPLRLSLVALLCEGDAHVSLMAQRLGHQQATVSQQLRILRMADLVRVRHEQGFSVYTLGEPRLAELIDCIERCGSAAGRRPMPPSSPNPEIANGH